MFFFLFYLLGSPFVAAVQGDSPHNVMVSGSSLSAAPVGKTSYFTLSNVAGGVEDIEVNVEGRFPGPILIFKVFFFYFLSRPITFILVFNKTKMISMYHCMFSINFCLHLCTALSLSHSLCCCVCFRFDSL